MGHEAVQALKLVLALFMACRNFFCSKFKPIIYFQFTPIEFIRSYSQQKFVEDSKISYKVPAKEHHSPHQRHIL